MMRVIVGFAAACLGLALLGCEPVAHPRLPSPVPEPATNTAATLAPQSLAGDPSQPAKNQPKAVAEAADYDFGHMALGDRGEHVFMIRNAGTAELTLRAGSTSCYCTEHEVLDKQVPPGGVGRVSVVFEPKGEGDLFVNTADVITNDPNQRTIVLSVRGIKRALLAAEPNAVIFGEVPRGELRTIETIVYSQVVDQFEISEVVAGVPGVEVNLSDATIAEATEGGRRWAKKLRVTLSPSMPKGAFEGAIQLQAAGRRKGESFTQKLSIPVTGKIRHGLTVTGPKWQVNGLELGPIPHGEGRKTLVIVKAYGEDSPVIEQLKVTPDWIRVTTEAVTPNGKPAGLLRLTIEIPEDAPLCDHTGPSAGRLYLKLKDLPILDAKVDFAIID